MASGSWGGIAAPGRALRCTVRHAELLRLQLAWAAVTVASWMATIALTVVAYDAGGTPAVALAVLVRTLPSAVAGPFLGALIDRRSRSRCLLAAAAACLIFCLAAVLAVRSLGAVVLLVTAISLAVMVFRAAMSALLPELVDDATELTASNVLASAVESFGLFAGPALAGLLIAVQGPLLSFGAAALLSALATALLAAGRVSRPASAAARSAGRERSRDLLRLPAARLLLLLVLTQTTVSGGLVVLYPALAVDVLGVELAAVGGLSSAFGLGGVVASLGLFALAGSRRLGLLTAVALLLWSLPLLAVPLAPALVPVLLLLAVVGGGNALFDVAVTTLLQRAVPPSLHGRVFGCIETAAVLGLGAGAAAAAGLEELLGAAAALAALAAPLAVVALLALRGLRGLDRELAAPSRQVALLRALPPFALLPAAELERLGLCLRHVELPADAVVVEQGAAGSTYYVLEAGELEVAVDGAVVGVLAAGAGFGEVALLRGGVRTATITSRTPVVLWSLDGPAFLTALQGGGNAAAEGLDRVARERLDHARPRDPVADGHPSSPGATVVSGP